MKHLVSIAMLSLIGTLVASASSATAAGGPTIVMADGATFGAAPKPYPAETKMAVLSGDPAKVGASYTVRLKIPDGTRLPAHTHGDSEDVTVISGTLLVGVGSTFDAGKMLALPAGSYASIPSGTPHYAMARGETVVQINGVGPASMSLTSP
jgi:quercetin dioxygenase-like cupin family protein